MISLESLLLNSLTGLAIYLVAIAAAIIAHRLTLRWLDRALPDNAFNDWWNNATPLHKTIYLSTRYAATAIVVLGASVAVVI